MRAQGPSGDQVGPGQRPHTHIAGAEVKHVAIVQGGQGDKQAHLLACSRALRRWHLDLPTLLGAWGPKKLCIILWNMHMGGVNKLEMGVQILELFQGVDLI
jgi:hypothetical protein